MLKRYNYWFMLHGFCVFISPCSGCVCSFCSPSVINKCVSPPGEMVSRVICICGSHFQLFLLLCLSCLSHLCIGSPLMLLVVFSLIASSAACYALFLLQCPLSPFAECFISLLFESQHESPLWRSSFPLQAIFIKKLCFLIYLPAGWRVFKSLTMKTNTECTSAMCLDRCYNPQKCTVMAPCLQLQATYSPEMLLEFAKFCPDVWFPTERCNHTSCYILYFSELL